MFNHLKDENSPYLLQHSTNPVNWYAWNKQSLQKAKDENKPFIYEGFDNINEALAFLQGEIMLPLPVFFVGGNHEDWLFLEKLQKEADERKFKSPYFVASNLYFLGRAGIIKIMGIQVGYLSGICEEPGYKSSFSLFSAHLIKEEDLKNLFNQKATPHIFLFHEGPQCDLIKQVIEYFSPFYSFHGHMHFFQISQYGTTKCIQLEMCSPLEFSNNCVAICEFDGKEITSVYFKNFLKFYSSLK